MSYQQLIEGQRYQIFTLLAEGYSQSAIAKRVSVHRSTICRELKRNSDDSRYRPDRANTLSVQRRSQASKYRISQDTIWFVEMVLGLDWSPEQISAIAKRIDLPVSPEWIYQHIARNKAHVHTITFDNGGEFAGHEGIAAA